MTTSAATAQKTVSPPRPADQRKDMAPQAPQPDIAGSLLRSGLIRAKLQVGAPGDPEEKEADRLADTAMSGGDACCASCAAGGGCEDDTIRMKPVEGRAHGRARGGEAASLANALGGGDPMPMRLRTLFEPRFGQDLGHIRLHTNETGAASARAIGAKAFALGPRIAFGSGQYQPDTRQGQWLIAHEVAHVARGHGGVRRMYDNFDYNDTDPYEGWTARDHINAAIRERSIFHAKSVSDYTIATRDEKLDLIRIILNQWWVGPSDESALERIWTSFGNTIAAEATAGPAVDLWNKSIDAGAELGNLAPVRAFAAQVQTNGVPVAETILQQSELRLNSERIRYGLVRQTEYIPGGRAGVAVIHHDTMMASVDTAGLAAAARRLAIVLRRIEFLSGRRSGLEHTRCMRGDCFEFIDDHELHRRLGEEIDLKRQEYNLARAEAESQFPVLAAFAQANDAAALESIAGGAGGSAAATINEVLSEKLENIKKVRGELAEDPALIWKLDPVLEATLVGMGYTRQSIQSGFITARKDAIERDRSLIEIGLGLIALGLGIIAAIPTGGLSLVAAAGVAAAGLGAAGISGYLAFEHLQEYQFLHAAAGSDFDKARAISSEDPSLFWVALDIVGVVFDFAAAKAAFSGLSKSARALRNATEATIEAERAAVRTAAREAGHPELAERIIASAERGRMAESAEATLSREVEEAMEGARREFSLADDVGEGRLAQTTEPGSTHGVSALPNGTFAVCSDPCHFMRGFFATELAADPQLEARLAELERRSARAHSPMGNKAEIPGIREEAATLSADLRRAKQVREHLENSAANPLLVRSATNPEPFRLRRVTYETCPDVLPPGEVLEFPNGLRVWREPGTGEIINEAPLIPNWRQQRLGTEADLPSRGDMARRADGTIDPDRADLIDMRVERAHSLGPGTTAESPYAIRLAPAVTNQDYQNKGIELYLRYIRDHAYPQRQGVQFRIRTSTATHEATTRLEDITYTLEYFHHGELKPGFQVTVSVDRGSMRTAVTVEKLNEEVFAFLPNIDELPLTMRERVAFMFGRVRE